ncbi:MAG: MarR family transcriptional regulator [Leptospiraceae bacterium]|nr:MarR family transcriptional regulator [Leptospiraceae bacterium]
MPTHFSGKSRDTGILDAYIKLMRASGELHSLLYSVTRRHDLTPSQFGVLECLYHLGPQNQKAVGEKLFFTEGNVTQVVRNLEKRKWILRRKDPDDARSMVLYITTSGKKKIQVAFSDFLEELQSAFSSLSNEDVLGLGRLCRTLGLHARMTRPGI